MIGGMPQLVFLELIFSLLQCCYCCSECFSIDAPSLSPLGATRALVSQMKTLIVSSLLRNITRLLLRLSGSASLTRLRTKLSLAHSVWIEV